MSAQQNFAALDLRRRQLGMTYAVLAKRSGVSMPTVVRILSGKQPAASFSNVVAIAQVLGMSIRLDAESSVEELCYQQARQKAQRLMGMLQGTSGLEGQALTERTLEEMTERTIHELLAGSRQGLWRD